MIKQTKDVVAMVIDHGVFGPSIAERLAVDMKRVYLCIPNYDAWPKKNEDVIGMGIPGIEVISDYTPEHLNDCDLVVFPDCGFAALQEMMLAIGKKVWGARGAERLEQDRPFSKQLLKKVGLPVGPYKVVHGMKSLRDYLKTKENVYVKVSRYRGTCESFHVQTYKESEPKLDKLEYDLGPLKTDFQFIVEDALEDMIETGYDLISIDGGHPSRIIAGFEKKNELYVSRCLSFEDLPEPLKEVERKLAPYLKSQDCRGAVSTEIRIGKEHKPYMIDFCARNPNPPFAIQLCCWKNYSDIVWYGANGQLTEPEETSEFHCQVMMGSDWANSEGWQPIDFPDEYAPHIKIANACVRNGQYYSVPLRHGLKEVCYVVGEGETQKEAEDMAKKICKTVSGCDLHAPLDAFDSLAKEISQAKEFGIDFFS